MSNIRKLFHFVQFSFEYAFVKKQQAIFCFRAQRLFLAGAFASNKPGTAKVGAISKAQNCKRGDPLGFVKLQLVVK